MCLTINDTFHKKGKSLKAEQNILVYKVLERGFDEKYYTPYQGMPINFNPNDGMFFYKNTRLLRGDIAGSIANGIHSFFNDAKADALANKFYKESMHYAIIPKGSRFFIGENGDIVSTNLVVFKTKKDYLKGKKLFGKIYSDLGLYLMDFWYEDCKSK